MNPDRLFGLVVGLLIVAALAVGWVVGVSPIVSQIAAANSERQNVEALNQSHQAQLDLLKAEYVKMPELTKNLAELQKSIPGAKESDLFVDELQAIATATGVSLSSVALQNAQAYGTAADGAAPVAPAAPEEGTDAGAEDSSDPASEEGATSPTSTPALTDDTALAPGADLASKFYSVPVAVSVNGPPAGIIAFVALCQKSQRLFLLHDWTITGYNGASATAEMNGHTFVIFDPAAVAIETPDPAATDPAEPAPTETPAP